LHKYRTNITMIEFGICEPARKGILKWILKNQGMYWVHLGQVRNKCQTPVYAYALLNHQIP